MSSDDEFDKLLDEDTDDFFEQWSLAKKAVAQAHPSVDPILVAMRFLEKTKIPYAIIGGKAAIYHISREEPQPNATDLLTLATSTQDYDVMVKQEHGKQFIEALQTQLRKEANVPLEEQHYDTDMVHIVLMGPKIGGMIQSVIDVHIVKPTYASRFPEHLVTDVATNLKYASRDWVCKELAFSMMYHASNDEFTKAVKRQARHKLLKCAP